MFIFIARVSPFRYYLRFGRREFHSANYLELSQTHWLTKQLGQEYIIPRRVRVTNIPATLILGIAIIVFRDEIPLTQSVLRRSSSRENL